MIETAIYGCWGSGTSLVTNILLTLGGWAGDRLLKLDDSREADTTGENIRLLKILTAGISQSDLYWTGSRQGLIHNMNDFEQDMGGWSRGRPVIAKHPLLCIAHHEARLAWPAHRRIIVRRGRDPVCQTMQRRGWQFWQDSHWDIINDCLDQMRDPVDLQIDYDELSCNRVEQIDRILDWLKWDPTALQRRAAISLIRPARTDGKIFVAIPSLADPELVPTLGSLYGQAAFPERVICGVYDQRDGDPPSGLPALQSKYPGQIRYQQVSQSNAVGVGNARLRANELMEDEPWFLQVDSHMACARQWDSICFDQWFACQDPDAVLTTTLPGYKPQGSLDFSMAMRLKANGFNAFGVPVLNAGRDVSQDLAPVLHHLMVAHFLFCPASVMRVVPPDPEVYFMGEEMAYAFRLFSHGFNIYAPVRTPMLHYYANNKARPRQWQMDPNWRRLTNTSSRRIRSLFGIQDPPENMGLYGPGSQRSLLDFERAINFNFSAEYHKHLTPKEDPDNGSTIQRIPATTSKPNVQIFPCC